MTKISQILLKKTTIIELLDYKILLQMIYPYLEHNLKSVTALFMFETYLALV